MSQLQVYKASAGAGKTFRLTIEYLKLALQAEYAYKHILAVTFTNKATAEMKSRILSELFKLSKGEKTAYLEALLNDKTVGLSAEQIKLRAHSTLRYLLHDFSRFSISTIDSFFQRVIKAFNKELGINGNFQVELDSDTILNEAVDQVILSVDKDPELFNWINTFSERNIEDGKSWSVRKDIYALAKEILDDGFKQHADELFERTKQKGLLQNYTKNLHALVENFYKHVNEIGKDGVKALKEANVLASEFLGKSKSIVNHFEKMSKDRYQNDSATMRACANDADKLLSKDSPEAAKNLAPLLSKLFSEYISLFDDKILSVRSAELILRNIYTLGILTHVQENMQLITHENSITLLAESGKLLQQIIDNSDTPFIYERTGVYYKHFMIDEFQDTSSLQWENFHPLLSNSLSEENLAMLVGDVKQAIYRWRGGDWKLLENQVGEDFKTDGIEIHQLTQNWRSTGEVIRYNNRIFQLAPQLLQLQFNNLLEKADIKPANYRNQIQSIYANGLQLIGQEKLSQEGYIQMRFLLEKYRDGLQEERIALVLSEMAAQIKDIQDRGAQASDIAILVRKGGQATTVANYLLEQKMLLGEDSKYNFSILSSDSLKLSNSPAVCFLICLLRLVNQPKNAVNISYANHQFYGLIEPTLHAQNISIDWSWLYNEKEYTITSQSKSLGLTDYFETLDVENNPFYAFLRSDFMQKDLSSRNLQEMVFKLAHFFHLFELSDELAYLQAFIDSVSEFQKRKISDLNSFLEYWDEKGKRKSISASETLDAIHIQTIHKSKGLEYKFVLIPFCDWDIIPHPSQAPIVWCKPLEKPFNTLNIVPIRHCSDMSRSLFKDEYFQEIQQMYIEAINLLYVAFTRSRTELYTWSTYNQNLFDSAKENNIKSIGDLLKFTIHHEANYSYNNQESLCSPLHKAYQEDKEFLCIGTKASFQNKAENKLPNNLAINQFAFRDFDEYLKLRKNHENFFTQDSEREQSVNKGKIIHEALALITTKNELPKALERLQHKGLFPKNELNEYTQQITAMIDDPEVAQWFDGSYTTLNERSILLGNTQGIRRPDRIMIKDNEAIVVDYKSGEHELEKYHKQVAEYMNQLKKCGFESVSGYLWYTKTNKRISVN